MVFSGLESELPIPGAGFTCKDPTNHSEDGRSCMLQPKTEQPSQRLTGLLTEGKCPGHGVTVLLCVGSAVWGQFSTLAVGHTRILRAAEGRGQGLHILSSSQPGLSWPHTQPCTVALPGRS